MVQEMDNFLSAAPLLGAELRCLSAQPTCFSGQRKGFKSAGVPVVCQSASKYQTKFLLSSLKNGGAAQKNHLPSWKQVYSNVFLGFPKVGPRAALFFEHDILILAGAFALLQHDSRI